MMRPGISRLTAIIIASNAAYITVFQEDGKFGGWLAYVENDRHPHMTILTAAPVFDTEAAVRADMLAIIDECRAWAEFGDAVTMS